MARTTASSAGVDPAIERDPDASVFRSWLKNRMEHLPMSLNAIEVGAGIRGNALGKFLRGERGRRHGLTPLTIRRLAPVLGVSEEALLARAGHLSHAPDAISVERAILADELLQPADKRFLLDFYRRLSERPTDPTATADRSDAGQTRP
jgi:transcriptional regulator with XRE-family HTH domain